MTIESVVQQFLNDAAQDRERFAKIASRTVSAVLRRGTPDDFSDIIRDATGDPDVSAGDGPSSVESGSTVGGVGVQNAQ